MAVGSFGSTSEEPSIIVYVELGIGSTIMIGEMVEVNGEKLTGMIAKGVQPYIWNVYVDPNKTVEAWHVLAVPYCNWQSVCDTPTAQLVSSTENKKLYLTPATT